MKVLRFSGIEGDVLLLTKEELEAANRVIARLPAPPTVFRRMPTTKERRQRIQKEMRRAKKRT